MEDLEDLSIEIKLKSIDYMVNVSIVSDEKFLLEIQNIETAEIWKGSFESSCKELILNSL